MEITLKKENKKAAIISYGPRIAFASTNVRIVDLIYLREYLINILGRDVDFVSRKSSRDKEMPYYKDIREVDLNDYDEVFIYNSALNVFGGRFDIGVVKTFEQLLNYKGDMYYMLADPKMPCLDIATDMKHRFINNDNKIPIANKKNPFYEGLKLEDFDNFTNNVWPNIKIAFQGEDYQMFYDKFTSRRNMSKRLSCLDWCNLPLSDYYAVNEKLEEKLKVYDIERPFDLIYFGNNRSSNRNKIIENLYDVEGNNNLIVGYDPEFKKCTYETREYVGHSILFEMIPTSAYATVILGDELHNNNMRSARFFESMLLDLVAFIWIEYDKDKKFVKNQELKDFIYVSTAEELREKLDKIKTDKDLFRHIIDLERQDIMDQFGHYKCEMTTDYDLSNSEESDEDIEEKPKFNVSEELF